MSDKVQVAETNTRKRKASGSLMNDDKVILKSSHVLEIDVDDFIYDHDIFCNRLLAGDDGMEHYTWTETMAAPPYKKRKTIHIKLGVITIDDAPRLDTLPMELLQQIIRELDYKSVLYTKFSSRRLYSACGNPKGTDFHGPWLWPWHSRREIRARASFHFEFHCQSPNKSGKLMCSNCYKSFGNDADGFSDEHFLQHLATRKCINCLGRVEKVHGIITVRGTTKLHWCRKCKSYKSYDAAAMKADLESFYDTLWLPHLAAISSNVRQMDKRKMTESNVLYRSCIETASLAHQSAMANCEKALSTMLEHTYKYDSTLRLMPGLQAKRSPNRLAVRDAIALLARGGQDRALDI